MNALRTLAAGLFLLAPFAAPASARGDEKGEQIKKLRAELEALRKRTEELEQKAAELTAALEAAKKESRAAQNAEKAAQARADEALKRYEETLAKFLELKKDTLVKPPPPVPKNLRGEVTAVAGDLVTLSIGVDAGLEVGHVLDIYRTDDTPRYLGTVKITSKLNLFPKHALATFTPARNVPAEKLRPEELPRKGDAVRPQVVEPKGDK